MTHSHVQLGKNGVTENFLKTLQDHFLKHNDVKVSVLKGAGHEKEKVKEYSQEIIKGLGRYYTAKVIGFTIFIKKWRKPVR
jgi:RNA-binding protein YhbY